MPPASRAAAEGRRRGGPESDAKVAAYREFLDGRLRPDLLAAEERRQTTFAELKDYTDLEDNLQVLQKSGETSLRTLVDLGEEAQVFCQAHVPDTSRVYVNIGLGFHVECTLEEAAAPISLRKSVLERKLRHQSEEVARIKADIKLVMEGMKELMNIPDDPKPARGARQR